MTKYIITMDGGTTNTRAFLWSEMGEVLYSAREEVGVRNTAIDGHNGRLKQAVRDCLERVLCEQGISYDDVHCIVASGMLSSNVGITEVPHLVAPATVEDFLYGTTKIMLPDICPLPIYIIPGLKNSDTPQIDAFEEMDIMRGEETESIPLIRQYGGSEPLLLVLPGSHNKFIAVDAGGNITGCLTTISGELLDRITTGTILADAVGKQFVTATDYDCEMVLTGSRNARRTSLSRACFSGRILNQFFIQDKAKIANYLLGAVYGEDLRAVLGSTALKLQLGGRTIVAGKEPLSTAMADVFSDSGAFNEVIIVPSDKVPMAAQGAYYIAKQMEGQL